MLATIKISIILPSLLILPQSKIESYVPCTTSILITNSNIIDINETIEKVFINDNKNSW